MDKNALPKWKLKVHEVIFEADTPISKLFDVILLWAILLSVFYNRQSHMESAGINSPELLQSFLLKNQCIVVLYPNQT